MDMVYLFQYCKACVSTVSAGPMRKKLCRNGVCKHEFYG